MVPNLDLLGVDLGISRATVKNNNCVWKHLTSSLASCSHVIGSFDDLSLFLHLKIDVIGPIYLWFRKDYMVVMCDEQSKLMSQT